MKIIYLNSDGITVPAALHVLPETVLTPLCIYELAMLSPSQWETISVILVPANADQRFLMTVKTQLEKWLNAGGTLVLNGHIAYPFLSVLTPFEPQDELGIKGLQVKRAAVHPIFDGVDPQDLTYRRGVAGFYARGTNPAPENAIILNTLGPNNLAIDWLLALPKGGRLLVHSGNDLWMYGATNDSAALLVPQLLQWLVAKEPAPVIAALDAGTYYHQRSLTTPMWQSCIDYTVYVQELTAEKLEACDIFIVSCSSPVTLLIKHKSLFSAFLASGKTLVVMGANHPEQWLDGVQWVDQPVNFWWWLEPNADSGLRLVAPEHDLFNHISLADATWHQHGAYVLPAGAVSLIDLAGVGSVLYEDRTSTAGRLLVTSLDPMYHHGSYFMPTTTQFLKGFLFWLTKQS